MPDLVTLTTPISNMLLGWLVETTLIASALAVLAAIATRFRFLSPGPAARHALWLMVMFKLVMPPLVHWPWSVPSPMTAIRAGIETPGQVEPTDIVSPLLAEEATAVTASASVLVEPKVEGPVHGTDLASWALSRDLGVWVVSAWLAGSMALAFGQARRVWRFRRLLVESTPAPEWLLDEADQVGRRLGVQVPSILVVPRLGTPLLWCLGRPVLLVPATLLKSLEAERWRAIVAHELAHLRRGDHWVRRLELVAGLAWWWNPLYWLARRQLDFEAELACDAWAVWALPKDRVSYAESLIWICTALSSAESPSPALGIAGTGRSFERRLTMILRDRVERRVSAPSLLAATLLAALALPSWTMARSTEFDDQKTPAPAPAREPAKEEVQVVIVDLDDDDDDAAKPEAQKQKQKAEQKAAEAKAKAAVIRSRAKMEAAAKEMEGKFGPGSEFAKKMEALSKELEGKFGPGSEFVKKMEALGKEIEEKFGPGSEFAREIEINVGHDSDLLKKLAEKFEEGGQDDAKLKRARLRLEVRNKLEGDQAKVDGDMTKAITKKVAARLATVKAVEAKERAEAEAKAKAKADARAKADAVPDQRTRRIEVLESRIDELKAELDRLKAESKPDKKGNRE
jgi:beta-lactamase regulating signal transducer with metallopeptidase domain